MAKGLKEGEANGRDVYPDIIDHPHWQSPTRPHMSLYDRAAQFSSFDALAGYSDMIKEEQRETQEQIRPGEGALENLDQKLNLIARALAAGRHPELSFTFFVPDARKNGGEYVTVTDTVKQIDPVGRRIILMSTEGRGQENRNIPFSSISHISGDLVDPLDDA